MKVRDILRHKSSELITIDYHEPLLEATRILTAHNIGVLLVTDTEGNPVGIISERDIVRVLAHRGAICGEIIVRAVMTEELIVGAPDDDLNHVMNVMTQQRIRHLPILDGDKLVGLISIGDVVKAQIAEKGSGGDT